MGQLLRTPLYDWHVAHGARMVEFGGWEMPVQYTSVIQEHEAVRKHVGLTDVSHMGRLVFEGPGAAAFLDSVLTRNVAALKPGQIRYSLLTDFQGRVLDDLLVGLLQRADTGEPYYYVVVNASNRNKDIAHFRQCLTPEIAEATDAEVRFIDDSGGRGMIALQGPRSLELLQPLINTDLQALKYYTGLETTLTIGGRWAMVSRTGYTGEDGFEIAIEPFLMEQFADELLQAGKTMGILPVGLGARDTLRLEAGMPLYGHELSEEITPFEAGLAYALHLDGPAFPGSDVLRRQRDLPLIRKRVGLEIQGKRPVREGCDILHDGVKVGRVSSGTFSPTLQKPIAMGYVPPELAEPGQCLTVDIRGKQADAVVVPLPFYKRT